MYKKNYRMFNLEEQTNKTKKLQMNKTKFFLLLVLYNLYNFFIIYFCLIFIILFLFCIIFFYILLFSILEEYI